MRSDIQKDKPYIFLPSLYYRFSIFCIMFVLYYVAFLIYTATVIFRVN